MICTLAKIIRTLNSFKNVRIYLGKFWHKSNFCIIWFGWLIDLYLFTPIPCNASFIIIKHICAREELSYVVFSSDTTSTYHCARTYFRDFALTPLTFGPCNSPTDTCFFTYHFLSVSITIENTLNCSLGWSLESTCGS